MLMCRRRQHTQFDDAVTFGSNQAVGTGVESPSGTCQRGRLHDTSAEAEAAAMSDRLPRYVDRGPLRPRPPAAVVMAAALLTALLLINLVSYAFDRVGLSSGWLTAALLGAVLGSRIDIPVARLHRTSSPQQPIEGPFGWFLIPATDDGDQVVTVAVNVGGALVPGGVATYLIAHDHLLIPALTASALVAVAVFAVARPIDRVGIVTPALLPPAAAALAAVLLGGPHIPALAYIAGTFGTLAGADLANLPRLRNLSTSVASIGGAGTFDGVFLSGILAVVLAAL